MTQERGTELTFGYRPEAYRLIGAGRRQQPAIGTERHRRSALTALVQLARQPQLKRFVDLSALGIPRLRHKFPQHQLPILAGSGCQIVPVGENGELMLWELVAQA